MNQRPIEQVAIIGFGEAGGIFGAEFAKRGLEVRVTDILLREEASREALLEKAREANVSAHQALGDAVRGAELIVSAVTSSSATAAAREAASFLDADQVYLDINSVSPEKKREVARILEASGAGFVEAAVMAPVLPLRLRVPMLLGGAPARDLAEKLGALGMCAKAVSNRIGVASAIKMCRSVLIKGIEALTVECLFAARRYGAEQQVLASIDATYPGMGWCDALPNYLVSRVAQHGRRRAAEMREAGETLRNVELDPCMALATAERQDWLVDQMAKADILYRQDTFSWIDLADRIGGDIEMSVSGKEDRSDSQ